VRGDSEPNRDIGGGHEDRATDGAAGTLELLPERHFDLALAEADLTQSEPVERVERRAGEPALQLGPIGREYHLRAADNDRRLGLVRLPNDERDRQGMKNRHDDVESERHEIGDSCEWTDEAVPKETPKASLGEML